MKLVLAPQLLPLLLLLLFEFVSLSSGFLVNNAKTFGFVTGRHSSQFNSWSPGVTVGSKGSIVKTENGLKAQLTKAGRGGLLAYGFLNASYYCIVTLITYILYFKSDLLAMPSGLSIQNRISIAAMKMSQIAAIVWAGSQITKALRIGSAIALAPFADRILNKWGEKKFAFLCQCLLGQVLKYFSNIFFLVDNYFFFFSFLFILYI